MNAPARHELYILEDGEKHVELIEDTKIPNAATIRIVKQDHTLGNMIRAQLLSMPSVLFAGYKVPHPLHPYFLLKLQTDGSIPPAQALEDACSALLAQLVTLEQRFAREFSLKEMEGRAEDPYGAPAPAAQPGWQGVRDYMEF